MLSVESTSRLNVYFSEVLTDIW